MNKKFNLNKEKISNNLKVLSKLSCHQIPERSFNIRGRYFPICSRCTGLYLGVFLYLIFSYFNQVYYSIDLTILAILMVVPTFLDGFTQFLDLRESDNKLRFVTGFFGGIGLSIIVVSMKLYLLSYV